MYFADWNRDQVDKLIEKLDELGWNKLNENSNRYIAGYTFDGNIFKIYKYQNKELYKVYYNSLPYFHYINKYEDVNKLKQFLRQFHGKRVVEIDDAGIGCPIGGIVICIYCKYTDLIAVKIVSLKYFQKPLYSTKQYLTEVSRRIQWGFKELNITRDYFIKICPGDIFKVAIEHLWSRKYNILTSKTEGLAHVIAETRFLQYLEDLGVPKEILDVNPRNIDYKEFNHAINRFLRENPLFKRRFFKTGWYKDR
ncbi:MAG: hypothetical protein ACTSRP_14340 [Candidatus Helarchaeota archaeon]